MNQEIDHVFHIKTLKGVSSDIESYGYCKGFWNFNVKKCLLIDVENSKMKLIEEPFTFMFLSEEAERGQISRTEETGYLYAKYPKDVKISHSKKYKLITNEGGFISLGKDLIVFEKGQFELHYLIHGKETNYHTDKKMFHYQFDDTIKDKKKT